MRYMKLDELLSRLKKHKVHIAEDRSLEDGKRIRPCTVSIGGIHNERRKQRHCIEGRIGQS